MLQVQSLSITRGTGAQAHTVHLPQLHLRAGQIMAITGESGCGKSTLLESLGLLLKPQRLAHYSLGHPRIDLHNWPHKSDSELAHLRAEKIGFILQSGGLIPYLSVAQNIHLPRRFLGLSQKSAWMDYAIEELSITHLLTKPPSALSIGERQRVAFIRALAHEPQLLLADEPTAALDPHHAQRLFALFLEIVSKLNICALVVSHDWSLVEQFELPRLKAQNRPGVSTFV